MLSPSSYIDNFSLHPRALYLSSGELRPDQYPDNNLPKPKLNKEDLQYLGNVLSNARGLSLSFITAKYSTLNKLDSISSDDVYSEFISKTFSKLANTSSSGKPSLLVNLVKERKLQTTDKQNALHPLLIIDLKRTIIDIIRRERAEKRGGDFSRVAMHNLASAKPRMRTGSDQSELQDLLKAAGVVNEVDQKLTEWKLIDKLPMKKIAVKMGCKLRTTESHWTAIKNQLKRYYESN